MTPLSQSPRDRILWILSNNGGQMERSRLRASTGMRYALLNTTLEELIREGRIKMTVGKQGDRTKKKEWHSSQIAQIRSCLNLERFQTSRPWLTE